MAKGYDVEVYGPQNNDGVRVAKYNSSNFPPVAGGGSEELKWGNDLRSDPTVSLDPTRGYDLPRGSTRISEV